MDLWGVVLFIYRAEYWRGGQHHVEVVLLRVQGVWMFNHLALLDQRACLSGECGRHHNNHSFTPRDPGAQLQQASQTIPIPELPGHVIVDRVARPDTVREGAELCKYCTEWLESVEKRD